VAIVDVSNKSDVPRYAEAVAITDVKRCNSHIGIRAAKYAHKFLPFLHPIPLDAGAECRENAVVVKAYSVWKTGVEMDALFGAMTAAILTGGAIKQLRVVLKTKGDIRSVEGVIQNAPITRSDNREATAEGKLVLKNVDKVSVELDKGHPLHAAKTIAALNSKRLCELIEGACPHIEHLKVDVRIERVVHVEVFAKSRDISPELEALFAAGSALLTIWDMVKKYEKDERGQYPDTYIADLKIS